MCIDVQEADQLRAERHHDHEIEYVRELYARDGQQEQTLIFDDRCWCSSVQKSLTVVVLIKRIWGCGVAISELHLLSQPLDRSACCSR